MVEIRRATVEDAAVLSDLWTSVGLAHRPEHVAGELAAVLGRDPGLVLIAQDGRGVIGSVFGAFDGRRGWLNRLATRSDARGEGVAAALVTALESALRGVGCRKVNLHITPDNAGVVTFYERHGYAVDELIFMEKYLAEPADHPGAAGSAAVPAEVLRDGRREMSLGQHHRGATGGVDPQ